MAKRRQSWFESFLANLPPRAKEFLHRLAMERIYEDDGERCQACGGAKHHHCADWKHCHCKDGPSGFGCKCTAYVPPVASDRTS